MKTNEYPQWYKYLWFTCLGIGLMLMAFLVITAQAVEIDPGENYTVNCTANETVNISCTECPECNESNTTCGVCSVEKTLSWNETYTNDEGNCDLEIYCEEMNLSQIGLVNFPLEISLEKDTNNTVVFHGKIYDKNGRLVEEWGPKEYLKEDMIAQRFKYDFQCPAELNTEVNLATCSPYLEYYFNTSDPMMFQLITGQSLTLQKLVDCQSTVESNVKAAGDWETKHSACVEQKAGLQENLEECQRDCSDSLKETIAQYAGYANSWMAATIFLVLVIIVGGLWQWYLGTWKGGGG